jgi:microcystin-dependent protein
MEIIYIYIFILTIIVIYLLYRTTYGSETEKFTVSADIENQIIQAVNDKYKADIDAMRNLAQISSDIMNSKDKKLTIPADITTFAGNAYVDNMLEVAGKTIFYNDVQFEPGSNITNIFSTYMIMMWLGNVDPAVGSISPLPKGWALCDGKWYIIDTDGYAKESTEKVGVGTPDLRGRFLVGAGTGVSANSDGSSPEFTNKPLWQKGGSETVTLTENQMPTHSHYINWDNVPCSGSNCGIVDRNRQWPIAPPMESNQGTYRAVMGNPEYLPHITNESGGNVPHNNMPPWYAINYIMKL